MKIRYTLAVLIFATLSACGGGGDSTPSVLAAGQSLTLKSGDSVGVPSGTIIHDPSGNTINVGAHNTINVLAGSVVSVPTSATGPADSTIITK